ncbi:phosphogluconate dehydratase [Actinocorallia sp. API 0066]|uniref:phosphogluconate dehydratase n=1 Tax=Actinocorallia sp. API 0066 TaxID=2896846 RepID=UPI001E5CE3DA|nr:phosphogluconate dehydratase [Actinocorallia sp. API 0066]MCD0452001.1 phosphogluconate dehydratase [Actinocorallia sp. API 0066]
MAAVHPVIDRVTARVAERSAASRAAYLARVAAARAEGPVRGALACGNLAHGFAACSPEEKEALRATVRPNVAIVTSYNDMLSAHQPFRTYPEHLKKAILLAGGVAQVAGGVPAMCDGVTQGRAGMELSLFSRDVVAMSAAIALAHDMFDAALMLGVCDKIVPGLVIGALSFGHLPTLLVPAGPMHSGLPNAEKGRIRKLYAVGEVGRDELLDAEAASYHSPGTCTFYGTANSNQMLMEVMGLHLPGASFVAPNTPLRAALTAEAGRRAVSGEVPMVAEVLDERAFVNGVVALLATGGSTNHTLHLPAMAAAAGIELTWDDFAELSTVTPLLTRIYPNGGADVNHFHAAGGTGFLIRELLSAGLLHGDVKTVAGDGLGGYTRIPSLDGEGRLRWEDAPEASGDDSVLRPASRPFSADGGLRMVEGNVGRGVVKVSAVAPEHRVVEAPARVFTTQEQVLDAFKAGELNRDVVIVLRYQGPKATGMPELHKLTPPMSVLQDKGHKVAFVTDGRMSGASGAVPAAIHMTPEAAAGGPIARVRDGDLVRFDADSGKLEILADLAARDPEGAAPTAAEWSGTGRDLFGAFRAAVGPAERGASVF